MKITNARQADFKAKCLELSFALMLTLSLRYDQGKGLIEKWLGFCKDSVGKFSISFNRQQRNVLMQEWNEFMSRIEASERLWDKLPPNT